jgi:hypothetical protein
VTRSCSSLFAADGPKVAGLMSVPVVLTLIGLLGALRRKRVPQAVVGGVLVFSLLLSGLFMYFAPAGAALIVSAALVRPRNAPS